MAGPKFKCIRFLWIDYVEKYQVEPVYKSLYKAGHFFILASVLSPKNGLQCTFQPALTGPPRDLYHTSSQY